MLNRDAKKEFEILVDELGVSEEEALQILGLESLDDPLVANTADPDPDPDPIESCPEIELSPVDQLAEMFPRICRPKVAKVLEENDNDTEKAAEFLLNWSWLEEEIAPSNHQTTTTRENKRERELRKQHHKHQRAVENEEKDIDLIVTTLGCTPEEARELYWLNENNVSEVLAAKIPWQQVISRSQMRQQRFLAHSQEATDEEVDDFSRMSFYELRDLFTRIERKRQVLQSKMNIISKEPWNYIRASDAAAELCDLNQISRNLKLALFKKQELQGGGAIKGLRSDSRTRTVDLHGCTVDQARVLVEQTLRDFKESSAHEIEYITGAGRHSIGGQAVLKPWLRTYLKKENVRMEEQEGSFVVSQTPRT